MRPASKSILYFVSDVVTSLVGFLATLYFARVLGAGPLGQYFLVIALIGWMTIPTNGIAAAVNKRISEGYDLHEIFSAATAFNVGYGLAVAVIVIFGGQWINMYVGADVTLVLAALFIVNVIFTSTLKTLVGQKQIVRAGFLRTGDRIVRVGAQVGLLIVGFELFALLAGHAAALIASSVAGLVLFGFRPTKPSVDSFRSLAAYGRYSWLGSLKNKAFGWMDTLVLGLFVSSGLIGVYEISWRLASILILVSNAVETTLFPEISNLAAEGDREEVKDLLSEAVFYAGIFVIPGFFGVLVLGPKILRIYGPEFVKGAPILLLLIGARAINVYEMQFLNVINGIDRPDVAFRINVLFIFANGTLNLILVWFYGWWGAAVATLLSSLVVLMTSYRALDRLVGMPRLPLLGIAMQITAAALMAGVLVISRSLIPVANMYATVAFVLLGAFVYVVALFALSGRVREKTRSLGVALTGSSNR